MTSANTSGSDRIPSSSKSPTGRAKACFNCRRKKIRCDGARPICTPCSRSLSAAGDCEYPSPFGGPSEAQVLEENIARLENRLRELQGPGEPDLQVIRNSRCHLPRLPPLLHYHHTYIVLMIIVPSSVLINFKEFTRHGVEKMFRSGLYIFLTTSIDSFLESNPSQVGFFLDGALFRQAALVQEERLRPCPSLLDAVFLWVTRVIQPSAAQAVERSLLVKILAEIPLDIAGTHPKKVEHVIQTEVLLSMYYLHLGKPLDGTYHCNIAISLAMAAGLYSYAASNFTYPDTAEKIHAFWAVVKLNNYWVVAHGSASAFLYDGDALEITTPWPLDLPDYQTFMSTVGSGATVKRFLAQLDVPPYGTSAAQVQASILLEQSCSIDARYARESSTVDSTRLSAFSQELYVLDSLVESCLNHLASRNLVNVPPHTLLDAVMTETMLHVTVVKLHFHFASTSEASLGKCTAAANRILGIINSFDFSQVKGAVDPLLPTLWTIVAEFMHTRTEDDAFSGGIRTIIDAMNSLPMQGPLTTFYINRLHGAISTDPSAMILPPAAVDPPYFSEAHSSAAGGFPLDVIPASSAPGLSGVSGGQFTSGAHDPVNLSDDDDH
ncbi:hypothetical protein FISHEDRAFT_62702 [Fistulina hepatica ATCC 64428]|nr:hypothetical protein FISHEDRAFT_62702 [Fistulina hepatica ATCC 64428]